jgi:hypothetical protein
MEPKTTHIHDAITGETMTRELTAEEIAELPEVLDVVES